MKSTSSRAKGGVGEDIAAEFLSSKGYSVIERNYYTGHTELDIIAVPPENDAVVFVEVKSRAESVAERYGRPAFAVGRDKQKNLIAAAEDYMSSHPDVCEGRRVRIDVVEVFFPREGVPRVRHIRSAVTVRPGYNM